MTTTSRPELIPVTHADGSKRYASVGATHQGSPEPMKKCTACGSFVVFVKSTKTGKFYLANCYRYHSDGPAEAFYYRKDKPHFASCEQRQAENARLDAINERERIKALRNTAIDEALDNLGPCIGDKTEYRLQAATICDNINIAFDARLAELEAIIEEAAK